MQISWLPCERFEPSGGCDDVRMLQSRRRACFLLESTEPLGVGGHFLGQYFDRDLSTQFEIAGLVHFSHAARAQLGEDFVVTEARAGLEGHG